MGGCLIDLAVLDLEVGRGEVEGSKPLEEEAPHPIHGTGCEVEALWLERQFDASDQLGCDPLIVAPMLRSQDTSWCGDEPHGRVAGQELKAREDSSPAPHE